MGPMGKLLWDVFVFFLDLQDRAQPSRQTRVGQVESQQLQMSCNHHSIMIPNTGIEYMIYIDIHHMNHSCSLS